MKSAQDIAALANVLGMPKGLRLVASEMDSFREEMSHDDLALTPSQIADIDRSLRSLGGAIADMRRVVSGILAEAGITSNYVG